MSCTQNSFRSTSLAGASPRRVETCICTTFQWQPSFSYSLEAPSDGGALCTCLRSPKYHCAHFSLAGSEEADRRLAKKDMPGRKDGLPFSCSLPELWCCVESLAQRKATPASVSLQTHFAERELHAQFGLGGTARKCLSVELKENPCTAHCGCVQCSR